MVKNPPHFVGPASVASSLAFAYLFHTSTVYKAADMGSAAVPYIVDPSVVDLPDKASSVAHNKERQSNMGFAKKNTASVTHMVHIPEERVRSG